MTCEMPPRLRKGRFRPRIKSGAMMARHAIMQDKGVAPLTMPAFSAIHPVRIPMSLKPGA